MLLLLPFVILEASMEAHGQQYDRDTLDGETGTKFYPLLGEHYLAHGAHVSKTSF